MEFEPFYEVLKAYNFGPNFIQMIKVCHNDIKSVILNNGYTSEPIIVTRGLRQGCPLSCLCFDLLIEIIAIRIRQNQDIEGITVGTKTKKLGQYTDDLWVSLKHRKKCYLELFSELTLFGQFCGLKVNYDKTEILRIGSLRATDASYYSGLPLHWSDRPVKILGILVTGSNTKMAVLNYKQLMSTTRNICQIWSKRSSTLLGRILIVNTLIVPTWVCTLQVLKTPPKEIISEFKKVISQFLWEEKRAKIAHDKMILPYKKGGLKLADIVNKDTALKVKWAQCDRLLNVNLSQMFDQIHTLSKEDRWLCNTSRKDIIKMYEDSIFRDIMIAWAAVNHHNPTSKNQILNQMLWYNSFIKIQNQMLYIPHWYKAGIKQFKDMLDEEGCPACNYELSSPTR